MCKGKKVLKSPCLSPEEIQRRKGLGSLRVQGDAGARRLGPECWSKSKFSLSQSREVTSSVLYFGILLLVALPTVG